MAEYPLKPVVKSGEIVESMPDMQVRIAIRDAIRKKIRENFSTALLNGDCVNLDDGAIDGTVALMEGDGK